MPTPETPILLFFATTRSGPARRMESLLAHLARKERDRLRVWRVDAEQQRDWVERFKVSQVPTLVLVNDRKPVARLEGRASAPQIERMIQPYLPEEAGRAAAA
ncbi:MAG: thioredoxin family protein [Gaiellaceae bacterium]